MSIDLITFTGKTVTSKDDAITYDMMIGKSGIVRGCELSFLGANQVRVAAGRGIIKGRLFTIQEEIIRCQMSSGGQKKGRIYIKMDLSQIETPIEIMTVAADELPELLQEKNCNYTNGIWEMELGTYDAQETMIDNLEQTWVSVSGIDVLDTMEEIEANTDEGRIAGALAVKKLNGDLGGVHFGIDADGKPGFYEVGADTVTPFTNKALNSIYKSGNKMDMSLYFKKEEFSQFSASNFKAIISGSASCRYAYAKGESNMNVSVNGKVVYNKDTGIATASAVGTSSSSGGNSGQTLTASGSVLGIVFVK